MPSLACIQPSFSSFRSFVQGPQPSFLGNRTACPASATGHFAADSPKCPRLAIADRVLWIWLSRFWTDRRRVLFIVKPATVVSRRRKSFRLFWIWKWRQKGAGRPPVAKDTGDLIRRMSRENPLWGAPRCVAPAGALFSGCPWRYPRASRAPTLSDRRSYPDAPLSCCPPAAIFFLDRFDVKSGGIPGACWRAGIVTRPPRRPVTLSFAFES